MQHGDHYYYYYYYYYYKDSYKTTKYYACRKSRTTKCKVRLVCQDDGTVHIKGDHVCITGDDVIARVVQEEMRLHLELRRLGELRVLLGRIWRDVKDEMIRKYGERSGLRFLPKREAIGVIRRCRDAATGGDAFRAIETEQVRRKSDDDEREFLQINLAYPMEGKYRRIVRFEHPDLIRLIKYPGITLFVDATFSVTPKPFTQTIIVMIYDQAHDLYVPCYYILVDTKDHRTYWNVFQWIKIQMDMACVPSVVMFDFEQVLHLGSRDQFESAHIVSCLFHWKQYGAK